MAYSTLKDPSLEVQFRSAILDMGHELFVLVVKDSIGHPSLKDFASSKSMGVLNKKFSPEQIKDIQNGLLEFHKLDIGTLFQLAKYDCNIPVDDWKTEGTLAFYLGKIKNERNELAHTDIHLNREIVERKLDELKCLYENTLQQLGENKCSQGGSIIIYQHYADSIMKRLDALRPKVTNEDLAVKIEHLSSKLDKMPLLENHGKNPSSVDQCDSNNQQIRIVSRISSQSNITSSVDQCDSAKQQIDDTNGTIVSKRVEDTTTKLLEEITSSVDHAERLETALNHLSQCIKSSDPAYHQDIIILLLPVLEKYQHNIIIQHHGLYIMNVIVIHWNSGKDFPLSSRLRNKIVEITLNSLEKYVDNKAILQNGLNLLTDLSGAEIFTKYKRVTMTAMAIFHKCTAEEKKGIRVQSLKLLSKLAEKAEEEIKETMNNTGILKDLLSLSNKRIEENICDEVLEESWMVLWNLTYRSRAICTEFINENGHSYFQRCLKIFPNIGTLIWQIMGALRNVLEFQELRGMLIQSTIVETTYELLLYKILDSKVSYGAAAIMFLIASDRPEAWVLENPTRQQVLDRLVATVERGDPNIDFGIEKITFKEELRVLQDFSSPELQHVVLWSFVNLTKINAEKHCTMLEEEHGIPLLQKIVVSIEASFRLKELAQIVLKRCQDFKNKPK